MKTTELELATAQPMAVATIAPTPIAMMKAILDGGVTKENVLAFEKLAELQWKFEAREAEKTFASAFGKLQSECKNVKAVHVVPTRDGKTKYKVAKFEEIWEMLKPLFEKYEFTASFAQNYEQGMPLRVTQTLILQHVPSGHKIPSPFTVRVGATDSGMQEYQSDGKATTYAKTRAVCNCLNIVIEQAIGDDASALGDTTTKVKPEVAEELEHRAQLCNIAPAILKYVGAATFADIPVIMVPVAERMLAAKERIGR